MNEKKDAMDKLDELMKARMTVISAADFGKIAARVIGQEPFASFNSEAPFIQELLAMFAAFMMSEIFGKDVGDVLSEDEDED